MSRNICRRQFTCRSFSFNCAEDEKESFYVSQWSECRVKFCVYRILICLYSIGWTIAYFIDQGIYYPERLRIGYIYLTNWGDVTNSIYFTLAAALSIVGVRNRRQMIFTDSTTTKILRSATWMFYTIVSCAQLIILITFWALLAPGSPSEELASPFNIHRHAITWVLVFIDIWVAKFPIRLPHLIYAMLYSFVWILMSLIVHWAGVTSSIYSFLDWAGHPGRTAGIAIAFAIFGSLIGQCVYFGIYNLRLVIAKSCCSTPTPTNGLRSSGENVPQSSYDIDNPAFEKNEIPYA